ncbi:hypothetical protein [Paraburkholderia sp. SIMBA_054]|uniref:hypothetical protein n=1 Tax=Paraburkholderia sp. SIMBA_054 TaxID=3085795 RepID=UPI0039799664
MKMRAATSGVLKQQLFTVEKGLIDSGTRLTLEGLTFDPEDVPKALAQIARGFEIPVRFNSESLPQVFALDVNVAVQTPIGWVEFRGLRRPDFRVGSYLAFLQGVSVSAGKSYRAGDYDVVIHLDSTKFRAKLPDRHLLIDAQSSIEHVDAVVRAAVADELRKIQDTRDGETFVQRYWHQCVNYAPELLRKVDVAPAGLFKKPYDVLCTADWHDVASLLPDSFGSVISRERIETGDIRALAGDCNVELNADGMSALKLTYLIAHGGILMDQSTPAHFWATTLPSLDDLELTFEVVEPGDDIRVADLCEVDFIVPCKAVLIKGPWGDVTIEKSEIVISDDSGVKRLYSPEAVVDKAEGVRQVESFSSDDELDEESRRWTESQLYARLKEARGASPVELLQSALDGLSVDPRSVRNKRYLVEVSDNGSVTVKQQIED